MIVNLFLSCSFLFLANNRITRNTRVSKPHQKFKTTRNKLLRKTGKAWEASEYIQQLNFFFFGKKPQFFFLILQFGDSDAAYWLELANHLPTTNILVMNSESWVRNSSCYQILRLCPNNTVCINVSYFRNNI